MQNVELKDKIPINSTCRMSCCAGYSICATGAEKIIHHCNLYVISVIDLRHRRRKKGSLYDSLITRRLPVLRTKMLPSTSLLSTL